MPTCGSCLAYVHAACRRVTADVYESPSPMIARSPVQQAHTAHQLHGSRLQHTSPMLIQRPVQHVQAAHQCPWRLSPGNFWVLNIHKFISLLPSQPHECAIQRMPADSPRSIRVSTSMLAACPLHVPATALMRKVEMLLERGLI